MSLVLAVVIASGLATRYDPGVMDPVVANRVMWGEVDLSVPHVGYVALLDREHVGRQVWLETPEGLVSGPYLVADCANGRDRARLAASGWAVDLSYEVAVELGVVDAPVAGFRVWDAEPDASATRLRLDR